MKARSMRKRLRQQHHEIFEQLQKNRYLQYIQNLLQDQISLEIPNNNNTNNYNGQQSHLIANKSTLTQVFTSQLQNLIKQLRIQKQKLNRVNQQQVYCQYADNSINKILELNQKINKLKQFYIYCKYLKVSTKQLENDIEKYFQYQKTISTVCEQVRIYLNNNFASDVIFKEYLKTYNVNIFTADLISHYFELNKKALLVNRQSQQNLIFQSQRIPQLSLLKKQNIVFKQLYEINQKYTQLMDEMRHAYVSQMIDVVGKLVLNDHQGQSQHNEIQNSSSNQIKTKKSDIFQNYNNIINEKLQSLNYLINKMSLIGTNLNQNLQNPHIPLIVNQYYQNFTIIKKCLTVKNRLLLNNTKEKNQHYKKFIMSIFNSNNSQISSQKQSLAAFFQENLILDCQEKQNFGNRLQNNQAHKFEFLQNKIIKTQTLLVLNKIFSTLNVFSYVYQQINPSSTKQTEYIFKSLANHIQTDFKGDFIKKQSQTMTNLNIKKSLKNFYHSPRHKSHYNVFVQTDHFGNWILLSGNIKLLYPSAIYGLLQTLHYMTEVATILQSKGLYSSEIMLQILSLKAQQMSKIGEVILNIYNIIKSKQVSSYDILSDYLTVNLKSMFDWELQWIDKLDLSHEENQMFINQLEEIQNSKLTNLKYDLEIDHQKIYLQEKQRIAAQITNLKATKFLTFYAEKAKKADFLSQIIYEIDTNYEICPILEQLLKCQQFHNKTFYFYDNTKFYETMLYEIIQMRNHIKLDHYYTLPRLHQKFGFFTTKALSFGDILSQLSKLSANQIKVQELLMFFKTQLRLKRKVFQGELHWLSYKSFVENGKQKSFKDFVEQQGLQIFSLSEQPLEYFIINIKDFIRRVSLFEQQIEKFKYYEDIIGKMSLSEIKIKNLDSYLNILTNPQLEQLTKVLHYFNPVTKILKNENSQQKLFTDLKKTIQINNKIKLQQIQQNFILLEEKQKLGEDLFYHKSFGFELSYSDCFNIFVQDSRKSYLNGGQTLKILINRERINIIKHYEQILAEQKKDIHHALSFFRQLMIISLLLAKDDLIDDDDKQIIEQMIENMSFPNDVMKQIRTLNSIFANDQQNGKQSSQIYILLKMKKFLHRLAKLTESKQDAQSFLIYNNNRTIENICLISKLSTYTQKKILQKIQKVHQQITIKDLTNNKKIEKQLELLNSKFIGYFSTLLKKHLNQFQTVNKLMISQDEVEIKGKSQSFGLKFSTIQEAMYQVQALLLHKVLTLKKLQSPLFKNKQDLILFDTLSGYKIKQDTKEILGTNIRGKDIIRRNDRKVLKKGIFSPVGSAQTAQNNIMQNIQKRVGVQMIKQSMGLRKVISKLELEQKKMRDQISWQTSKLQHNVINKIHAFIAQSNIDQQQSYINFKYTVNLQTIKGMQNVIKQQTQLAYKATTSDMHIYKQHEKVDSEKQLKQQSIKFQKKPKKESNDFFLTNPKQKGQQDQQGQSILGSQNSRMLNTNIDSIFNHMKKIKVFAAWKKINRDLDFTKDQWANFNKNVANILHNQENIKRIQVINQKRSQCFKENILCSLLKQENKILSEKIRKSKMESLNKTIQKYRMKLIGEEDEIGQDYNYG